jgi:hypothetical protein
MHEFHEQDNNPIKDKLISGLDYVIASCESLENPPTPTCEFDRRMLSIFKAHTLGPINAEMMATELMQLLESL